MSTMWPNLVPAMAAASTAAIVTPDRIPGLLEPVPTMILGAVVGACVAIGLQRREQSLRTTFLQFGISLGCGVLVTPLLFRWQRIPFDSEYAGPSAILVAAMAVGVLAKLIPRLEASIDSHFPPKPPKSRAPRDGKD